MVKEDRRVRRTRRLLREALFALLQERPYETITIQDITEEADVHRATFYLHYGTKEDLLSASLQALFEELIARLKADSPQLSFLAEGDVGRVVFEHVAEHADLYRVLVGQRGVGYVTHQIIGFATAVTEEKLRNDFPDETNLPIPLLLVARHVAGSLYALMSWWLENDMPYDAAYMADVTGRLTRQGVMATLGMAGEAVNSG